MADEELRIRGPCSRRRENQPATEHVNLWIID